ncbi:hypothetical protein J8Z69_11950 [Acinetobacter nosocomialis]|jgi:hypothetical protein|uniref:DUF6953 family protein n=1 Tax=Acinetobacter nosocomialis TaxID=106654 RepID=UPI001AE8BADC|nr:hypothetical protein [Acinetobacter nosocomialis]MBP1495012.1 hypothetical protein [Acinetobacter nosocomialis]
MTDAIVAQWLYDEILKKKWVDQGFAVSDILGKFGKDFVYYNENGNLAINKSVLREFNKLKKQLPRGRIEWDRSDRSWHYYP